MRGLHVDKKVECGNSQEHLGPKEMNPVKLERAPPNQEMNPVKLELASPPTRHILQTIQQTWPTLSRSKFPDKATRSERGAVYSIP